MAVDKGPLLTSAIIFYLSIGAAIFQVLEEPNWKLAVKEYTSQREQILKDYPCLKKDDLDRILEIVSTAAGQGVTITGNKTFNNWKWPNAVIFAATVITTIGYGNISPKTSGGRVFCIFYGLFGVPLCLTWISELGKFFGGRAKHLGQYLTKRGLSLRKAQFTCTALFLLWGILVHLLIPPFVFMVEEGWSYIDGLYFSFITLTTIGFGDLVAGVDPNTDYPVLYRYFVEVWIYLGLAWLSLFFNWKVRMMIEAHKALKKRRKRRKLSLDQLQHYKAHKAHLSSMAGEGDGRISFLPLPEKREGYNDLIKQIGSKKDRSGQLCKELNRSKSCNDGSDYYPILTLDGSPRRKRRYSFGDRVTVAFSKSKNYLMGGEGSVLHGGLTPRLDLEAGGAMFENQLDKEPGLEASGEEYQAFIYQNANITFIDEENLVNADTKAQLSTSDENGESETDSKEPSCESDGSVFTSDGLDRCHSYERLVEEYSKEHNTNS
ncbi:potassium channel subfamily K member 5a [Brienomyrus brachyistius]|uniref:potassium channel subfamily K member 5a n=1 Tax=Brienomyrus brachyistius TaxID=42636 RepID=UPI0020B26E37|nr:potassium channel subfamily K member 5a [Brienomyrus brachyistius]